MIPTDKRTKKLLIRFTAAEKERLTALARQAEITPTDYVRTRTLDSRLAATKTPAPSVERKMLANALGQMGQIGCALQAMRLELSVGDKPLAVKVDQTLGLVLEASEAILRALGIQP